MQGGLDSGPLKASHFLCYQVSKRPPIAGWSPGKVTICPVESEPAVRANFIYSLPLTSLQISVIVNEKLSSKLTIVVPLQEIDYLRPENEVAQLQESEDARALVSDQLIAAQAANAALEQELRRCQRRLSEMTRREKESQSRLRIIETDNAGLNAANSKLLEKVKSLGLKVEALRAGVSPDVEEVSTLLTV